MNVNVLFFGVARDCVGNRLVKFNFPQYTNVEMIRKFLEDHYPRLKDLNRYAIAVNNEYSADDVLINDGDEIAVLPPVSGG